MSEDELDDIRGRGGRGAGLQGSSSLFQPIREQEGRSSTEDLSVRMLPSNSTPPAKQNRSGAWLEQGAGLDKGRG